VKYYTNKARQAGMTLIELTVVLLVLVGLAGIMIPYVTGFVGKTHDATGSSNAQQIGNAIVRYESEFGRYPKGMDSLIVGASEGANTNAVITYGMPDIMGMGGTAVSEYGLTTTALVTDGATASGVAEICGSLVKSGMTNITTMKDIGNADFNATFNNAAGTQMIGMAMGANAYKCTGTYVAKMGPAEVAAALGLEASATTNKAYVLMGLGQASDIIGKTIQEAPVHFAKDADMNASQAYNRFGVIFEVDQDITVDQLPKNAMRAKYKGTVMLMNKAIGLQTELANYYKATEEEAN